MLIPALKTIIDKSSENGVDQVIMGMPHRYPPQPSPSPAPLLQCSIAPHSVITLTPEATDGFSAGHSKRGWLT